MKRLTSIDVTRGIVMIIMALDHVRDMIHVNAISQSPTDLATTTPLLFFTRWITYLCAPTFVFLAGTSVYLSFHRDMDIAKRRNFLLTRGAYLIALDLIVVNLALFFDPGYHTLFFEVIAAIGFGFIILGLCLKAKAKTLGIIGLIIIFAHNFFALIPFAEGSLLREILSPLFTLGVYPFSGNHVFVMAYPPIPWLGIMLVGYWAGTAFMLSDADRKKILYKIGIGAIILFCIIRAVNAYGDPVPWALQKNAGLTAVSILNVAKYPPSLLFCLLTLGIMLVFLAFVDGKKGRWTAVVSVYGKVPLFYFLIHFLLIHSLLIIILFLQGISWSEMDFVSGTFGRPTEGVSGLPLWQVYLLWIAVVAVLYKPCKWYGGYKETHQQWWLKYL